MSIGAQLLRFVSIGVLNTGAGLLCIWACLYFGGFGTAGANAMGYALGLLLSFALNLRWTFGDRSSETALPRWIALAAVAYAVNLVIVLALVRGGLADSYAAQPFGVFAYTLLMFFGARTFVFREAPRQALP